MRDDLLRLRAEIDSARRDKHGRVPVRSGVLEALFDVIESADRTPSFGQGHGFFRARAALTEAIGSAAQIGREG
jgi:hypothetical protein